MKRSHVASLLAAVMAVAFAAPAFGKKKTDVVSMVLRAFHIAARADTNARNALAPVGSSRIADSAVQTADLAAGAVTGAKLAAGGVGTADLADLGVTGGKLAGDSVTTAKIFDGTVGGKTFHVYGSGKSKQWIPVGVNPKSLKPPKGETWEPVGHHHDFKQIHGGTRADQFVNLSGNAPHGRGVQDRRARREDVPRVRQRAGRHEVAVGGHQKQSRR